MRDSYEKTELRKLVLRVLSDRHCWLFQQALFHMSRLDEALKHLLRALRYLGDKLPTSNLGVRMRIRRETIRHYLHVFLEGYFIGRAG